MSAPQLKTKLDYDDLATAPEDGNRYELRDGGLFVTLSPSPQHQRASKRLQRQLEHYFEERGLGEVFDAPLDVILPSATSSNPISSSSPMLNRFHDVASRPSDARRRNSVPFNGAARTHCYRLADQQYVLAVSVTGDQPFEHPDWPDLAIDPGVLWS